MFDNMHESASLPELPVIMPQKRTPRAGAHLKNGSGMRGMMERKKIRQRR